jgi:hypothetical protein
MFFRYFSEFQMDRRLDGGWIDLWMDDVWIDGWMDA